MRISCNETCQHSGSALNSKRNALQTIDMTNSINSQK